MPCLRRRQRGICSGRVKRKKPCRNLSEDRSSCGAFLYVRYARQGTAVLARSRHLPGNGQRQALPGAARSIAVDREGLFPIRLKKDQWPEVAFNPIIPIRRKATKTRRVGDADSLKRMIPMITAPSAPMPVHTA